MITATDRLLISHIEEFGFITVRQATCIFYSHQVYGKDWARKRLNMLVQEGYCKKIRNSSTNEFIFCTEAKKISLHNMLVMNFYSKLKEAGADIQKFEREKEWLGGDYRSDAFIETILGGYRYYFILEVYVSHMNVQESLNRYEDLYKTGEIQKITQGQFPRIIVVDDAEHKKPLDLPHINVLKLNFNLDTFPIIFA